MKFLIQFPTLARSEKFLSCFRRYVAMSSGINDLKFNINCDMSDSSMTNVETIKAINDIVSGRGHVSHDIHFDQDTTKVSSINAHIDDKEFDIVVCASDDMVPCEQNWDAIISSCMMEYFPNLDGCVNFNDACSGGDSLVTFSILGRRLYDYFGYIYHCDYKVLYCDNEFTEEVKRLGKIKTFNKVIIRHEHYTHPGSINHNQTDVTTNKTLYYSGRDAYVYEQRKKAGYPKHKITND